MKKSRFFDAAVDGFALQWLNQSVGIQQRKDFIERLAEDADLRREFCDWIRSLRDPWAPVNATDEDS